MDAEDRLRLDYDRTNALIQSLLAERLTLLALVPTVAGATVAVIGTPRPASELLGVGLVGLIATLGVLLYELGNTETLKAGAGHARELEGRLGIGPSPGSVRGLHESRLLSPVSGPHEWGLGLVYGAALGGWSYLVSWGALKGLGVSGAQPIGGVIGALVVIAVALEVERIGVGLDQAAPQWSQHAVPPAVD